MGNGLLLIVSGPSGAGKTTITRAIRERIDDAVFSVSATTRAKTAADVEGVDYHFVSDEAFDRMVDEDAFLEWAEVFGHKYGTPRAQIEEHLEAGRLVVLDIDVQGAQQVKVAMPRAFGIFIEPPDEDVLLERLRARQRDSEEVIQRRFAEAKREMAEARSGKAYDIFVVNDDLERAIGDAIAAIEARRGNL